MEKLGDLSREELEALIDARVRRLGGREDHTSSDVLGHQRRHVFVDLGRPLGFTRPGFHDLLWNPAWTVPARIRAARDRLRLRVVFMAVHPRAWGLQHSVAAGKRRRNQPGRRLDIVFSYILV